MFDYGIKLDKGGHSERGGCNRAIAVLPFEALSQNEICTSKKFVFEMAKALLIVERGNLRRDFEWQLKVEFDLNFNIKDYDSLLPRFAFPFTKSKECWRVEIQSQPSIEFVFVLGSRIQNLHIQRMGDTQVIEWMFPIKPILEALRSPAGEEIRAKLQGLSDKNEVVFLNN